MPQVFVIMSPKVKGSLVSGEIHVGDLQRLGDSFIAAVEKAFGIEGKNDVAFTFIPAECTKGEADFQVEVRYTAGRDEYGKGKPFDPTEEEQKALAGLIEAEFGRWTASGGTYGGINVNWTLSIWCKPFYNSHFQFPL